MSDTPNINDLRQHLFDALKGLSDKANPMDIERAKAIADVSQVVINTVKAETDMLRVTGQTNTSEFIPAQVKALPKRTPPNVPGLTDQLAGANIRTHRLEG